MSLNATATIPMSFFAVGLPVMLREAGASLTVIGFTALVYLPFALAFLWAPLLDRPAPRGMDRRRYWMLASMLGMAGLAAIAALLDASRDMIAIIALAVAISVGGATMRTTILGLAVERLDTGSRPWGAALLPAGGAIGALMGATGLLFVYGATGWAGAMLTMAAALVLLTLPGLTVSDRPGSLSGARVTLGLRAFFADAENRDVLLFVTPLAIGLGMGVGMMQPRLVDLGYTVEEIGVINGVFSCIAMLTGGPIGAWSVRRYGQATMIPIGCVTIVIVLGYGAAASAFDLSRIHAALSVAGIFLAFSFSGVMTNLLYMARCKNGREGTDFSLFLCFFWLVSMLGMIASGLVANAFGYAATFGTGAVVVTAALAIAPRLRAEPVPA